MNPNSSNSTNERARIRTILNSIPEERWFNIEHSHLESYYFAMGGKKQDLRKYGGALE